MDTRKNRHTRSGAWGAIKPTTMFILAIVAGLLIASWFLVIKPHEDLVASDDGGHPSTPVAVARSAAPPVNTEAMSINDLLASARKAMNEQRVVAPAGNNAFEFYLKVLQRQPGNQTAADALRETFPFAATNTEQTINGRDFAEAQREIDLLTKVDPTNYTLTILRSKLDAQRKTLDQEQQKQLDAQHQQDLAAQQKDAEQKAAADKAAADKAAADKLAQEQAALAAAQKAKQDEAARAAQLATANAATRNTPTATAAGGAGETREAMSISNLRPRYPATALRAGQEGWVDVSFTVGADGSTGNVAVVDSQPHRIFDSAAMDAVRRWKFSPAMQNGTAIASQHQQRIEFKLNAAQ